MSVAYYTAISQELAREWLNYIPETGELLWKKPGRGIRVGRNAGTIDREGYRVVSFRQQRIYAHRLIWIYVHGYFPRQIDHINHKKDDNRIENLRDATLSENSRNLSMQTTNTSGFCGVHYRRGKWVARIMHNGKRIELGSFSKKENAISARMDANREYGYHKNHGK